MQTNLHFSPLFTVRISIMKTLKNCLLQLTGASSWVMFLRQKPIVTDTASVITCFLCVFLFEYRAVLWITWQVYNYATRKKEATASTLNRTHQGWSSSTKKWNISGWPHNVSVKKNIKLCKNFLKFSYPFPRREWVTFLTLYY